MPDITSCSGKGCIKRRLCHRFTAIESYYQSYFAEPPYEKNRLQCKFFWSNKDYKNEKSKSS